MCRTMILQIGGLPSLTVIFVTVLSPYNVRLAAIWHKLIYAAEYVGRTDILQNVSEVLSPAYRFVCFSFSIEIRFILMIASCSVGRFLLC
ncbi:hypothetical protein KIN20_012085 [Parelaphostrongylus tenuis]|uniref:Uncharacterized protein n=1 Tax=Parelaphostrongylus tenuis TaxID=148309 RepID=A0AAD5MEY1_PARTN|nr:hypothetical protein KIN20_012085 [Parelaphostrongylus tenuis]